MDTKQGTITPRDSALNTSGIYSLSLSSPSERRISTTEQLDELQSQGLCPCEYDLSFVYYPCNLLHCPSMSRLFY
jgi:hypothetical protein